MTRSNHAQRRRRREDRKGEYDCSQLRSAEAEAEASLKSRSEHLAGLDLDLLLVLRERATRDFARRLRIEGLKPGSSESESESEGGWRSCSRGRCGVNESLFSRFPAGSTAQWYARTRSPLPCVLRGLWLSWIHGVSGSLDRSMSVFFLVCVIVCDWG